MNEPKQIGLFEQHTTKPKRQVEFVPPDPMVIKEYAYTVCAELAQKNPVYSNLEVVSGLASFLNFIAQTSAKYLNSDHQEYLLKGYERSNRVRKGVANGKKTTIKSAA
jgi:hypothetical protein